MKHLTLFAISALTAIGCYAQSFDDFFEDKTMRLDYIFTGDNRKAEIHLEEISSYPGWAGRKDRLAEKFLNGNGQVTVKDKETGETIYVTTFSTLFQEWQPTEEAAQVNKAFESTYLIPYPKKPAEVTITLTDTHHNVSSILTHTVDPQDILIAKRTGCDYPVKKLLDNGPADKCVDIAIIGEGYTQDEMDKFYKDADRAVEAIFSHEPFTSLKDRFNVVAVGVPSKDSGPSIPHDDIWHDTAVSSHFDTFYSARYLTTQKIHDMYDILTGVPFEQIIVLVNTPIYGGGGIFNQVNLAASDHPTFKEVLVHEFGHGYAGLADEYFYDDQYEPMYPSDTEPWEPNITTLVDFASKWQDMLPAKTKIPTPSTGLPNPKEVKADDTEMMKRFNEASQKIGVFEGGGYQSKGVYRPVEVCRMRANNVDHFCPVCTRAIISITDFYTGR